ncbi:AI-2E family transporter [Allocoleopsis sp.]|uniref:AI-2E family transporter n=1 Tax=Allocoleopsis sp. TaxID=3088169 RepID=UPI002FD20330
MSNFRAKRSKRYRNGGWRNLTSGAPLAVFLAVGLLILYNLLPVLELVAVALLLALVLRTTLRWLQKIFRVRWVAVMIMVGLLGGFGLFVGLVVIPSFVEEAQNLSSALPKYLHSLINLSRQLHNSVSFVPDLSQGLEQLTDILKRLVSSLPVLLRNTFDLSLQAVATLILAIYMVYDPDALVDGILRLTPQRQHKRLKRLLESTKVRLRGWIFGTGLAMLIVGVGAVIGLLILRIPLAVPLGIVAGILEIIPYVGPIVGAVLPALIALTIQPTKALLVLIYFLILNQVEVHLIQPIVMAQRVKLHPVMVILAFLTMGKLLGLIGILLAVPIAAVLVTVVDEFTPKEPPEDASP